MNITPAPGVLTRVAFDNTNLIDREYQGLILQHSYQFRSDLSYGAHYTLQIKNNVHFTTEGSAALAERVAASVREALGK